MGTGCKMCKTERNKEGQDKERDGILYSPSLGPGQVIGPLILSSCRLLSYDLMLFHP